MSAVVSQQICRADQSPSRRGRRVRRSDLIGERRHSRLGPSALSDRAGIGYAKRRRLAPPPSLPRVGCFAARPSLATPEQALADRASIPVRQPRDFAPRGLLLNSRNAAKNDETIGVVIASGNFAANRQLATDPSVQLANLHTHGHLSIRVPPGRSLIFSTVATVQDAQDMSTQSFGISSPQANAERASGASPSGGASCSNRAAN